MPTKNGYAIRECCVDLGFGILEARDFLVKIQAKSRHSLKKTL